MFKALFGVLQKIGRALMLPVAILPAAGILLAIGNAMQNKDMIQVLHFLSITNIIRPRISAEIDVTIGTKRLPAKKPRYCGSSIV